MNIRRLPITLMELLIVISIIATVAGIVGVSINKALIDQRFRTEISMILDEFRLAQDLMLILETDVQVKFKEEPDNSGIRYWIDLETKLPKNLQHEITRKHNNLKTIRGIFSSDKSKPHGKLDIKFFSKGAVMSKEVLKFSTSGIENDSSSGVLQNFICLPGYPKPILSYDNESDAQAACDSIFEREFDDKLTKDTFQRLPDKLKQAEETPQKDKKPEERETVPSGKDKKQASSKQKQS